MFLQFLLDLSIDNIKEYSKYIFTAKKGFMSEKSIPKNPPYKLTQEQLATVQKWLGEKAKADHHCEVCGNENFTILEHLVSPINFGAGFIIGGPAYPQVMAICPRCGNTKYFNAMLMGIVKNEVDADVKSSTK